MSDLNERLRTPSSLTPNKELFAAMITMVVPYLKDIGTNKPEQYDAHVDVLLMIGSRLKLQRSEIDQALIIAIHALNERAKKEKGHEKADPPGFVPNVF